MVIKRKLDRGSRKAYLMPIATQEDILVYNPVLLACDSRVGVGSGYWVAAKNVILVGGKKKTKKE